MTEKVKIALKGMCSAAVQPEILFSSAVHASQSELEGAQQPLRETGPLPNATFFVEG